MLSRVPAFFALVTATLILSLALPGQDPAAQSLSQDRPSSVMSRAQLPERVDLSCRMSPVERYNRLRLVQEKKSQISHQIQGLSEQLGRAKVRQHDFDRAYRLSDFALMISAVAGLATGVGAAAESFLGAASLQVSRAGVQVIPRVASGLANGEALLSKGLSIGGIRIAPLVLSRVGVRSFLATRFAMISADAYHLFASGDSAEAMQRELEAVETRFRSQTKKVPYLGPRAFEFLSSPGLTTSAVPRASSDLLSNLDQRALVDASDRLTAFHDEFSTKIGLEPGSIGQFLTEFMTHREGEQAALDVAVMELQMAVLEMRRIYGSDLESILDRDQSACLNLPTQSWSPNSAVP